MFRRTLNYLIENKYKTESLRSYLRNNSSLTTKNASLKSDYNYFARPPHILDRRLSASDRPLIVIFEEPGCEPCGRFHSNVLTDKNVLNWIDKFEAIHLDMTDLKPIIQIPTGEKISAQAWSKKLGLNYSPDYTVVFFDEKGKEVIRIDSEIMKYRMAGTLEYVFDKGYLQDSQFQRWRAIKAREKISKK
jgi:thioredoxin-related protein